MHAVASLVNDILCLTYPSAVIRHAQKLSSYQKRTKKDVTPFTQVRGYVRGLGHLHWVDTKVQPLSYQSSSKKTHCDGRQYGASGLRPQPCRSGAVHYVVMIGRSVTWRTLSSDS